MERGRKNMKVLMIEHFLPDSTYTLELGKELKDLVDLTVFCRKGAAGNMNGIRWVDGFYEGGKNKPYAVVSYLAGLRRLACEICRGDYDIVHVQGFKYASAEIPFYLRYRKKYRFLVHTVHNLLPHEAVRADRKRYLQFYEHCDLLLVHNEYCKHLLVKEYQIAPEKIYITPHGAYTLVEMEQRKKEHETVNFLQFGILRRYKGIDILFKALSLIPEEKRKRIHVTIAGPQFSKLDSTDYRKMAEHLGISKTVSVCCGYVPDEKLRELFGKTDFCLFPYRNIYGSGALLMAYSYGKPVIASDIPVFREEVEREKTGLLFTSENPEDLKNSILHATEWTKEQYTACTQRIQKLVEGKYSWKSSARSLVEAYQRL